MYDILQLKSKSLEELQAIAKEMGIKSKDDKNQLVYDILDEQAISASKNKPEKERRDRKKVARKNGPEKVYTADENGKAKSVDKKENAPKPEQKEVKLLRHHRARKSAAVQAAIRTKPRMPGRNRYSRQLNNSLPRSNPLKSNPQPFRPKRMNSPSPPNSLFHPSVAAVPASNRLKFLCQR